MVQATSKESDSSSCSRKGKSSRKNTTWQEATNKCRKASNQKIVSLFQVGNMPVPHDEFQDLLNRVRIRLGINSPLKHAKSRKQMTLLEDLHFCAGSVSWRQRCSMKAELIKLGMYVFAPSHQHAKRKTVTAMDVVYALKRQGRTLYGFGG
uniref:Histone H4 n=1 Tax=Ditylenchus dipsaci TaxID=166011 RepID=A0A915ESP8_9BILA